MVEEAAPAEPAESSGGGSDEGGEVDEDDFTQLGELSASEAATAGGAQALLDVALNLLRAVGRPLLESEWRRSASRPACQVCQDVCRWLLDSLPIAPAAHSLPISMCPMCPCVHMSMCPCVHVHVHVQALCCSAGPLWTRGRA